jgi:hypothetical protein
LQWLQWFAVVAVVAVIGPEKFIQITKQINSTTNNQDDNQINRKAKMGRHRHPTGSSAGRVGLKEA